MTADVGDDGSEGNDELDRQWATHQTPQGTGVDSAGSVPPFADSAPDSPAGQGEPLKSLLVHLHSLRKLLL